MDTAHGDTANGSVEESIVSDITFDAELCKQATHRYACGFHRDPGNPRSFIKKVRAPDGSVKTLRLNIISAITEGKPQAQASADAERDFLSSLNTDEVVIYIGHSRDGGGPDFNPPRLLANGEHDYAWYRAHRPGFLAIEHELTHSKNHPQLLALLSCSTGQHFAKSLKVVAPDMGMIVSETEEEFLEQVQSLNGTLDGLIGMKCHDSFMKDIQSVDLSSNETTRLDLIGFF
jgi:hypothetical protein